MHDTAWLNAEKRPDPDFEGSIFEELGFDNALCPTCDAHLRAGICLNACHLSESSRQRFAELAQIAVDRAESPDPATDFGTEDDLCY